MRLHSLAFAGYRSFAARSPASPARPLQRLQLAPLTLLLGKNNSGKSTAARLLRHVLVAIAHDGSDPFPMTGAGETYGSSFRDLQHARAFFNPLDVEVELSLEDGTRTLLAAQVMQVGDSADDQPPVVRDLYFGGKGFSDEERSIRGLLPDIPEAMPWRSGAGRLLAKSCHIGAIRDPVRETYEILRGPPARLPNTQDTVAQFILADAELRAMIGDWTAAHLEGWRVDVQQTLDVFKLLARRAGREINVADSGQGIQQVLPVIALCCWRNLGREAAPFLDIIEQPELHLHDAAHAALGDLLLSAVSPGTGSMVVETHSEALVLRIRRRVAEGLPPATVSLVYVDDTDEGSQLRSIPLRADGEVEWWPEGVFSEAFQEVKAIRRAQRRGGGT